MKLDNNFTLKNIAGEYLIISDSSHQVDVANLISFNETAAYLWEQLVNKDFEIKDVESLLIEKYNIDAELANKDAIAFVNMLKENTLAK